MVSISSKTGTYKHMKQWVSGTLWRSNLIASNLAPVWGTIFVVMYDGGAEGRDHLADKTMMGFPMEASILTRIPAFPICYHSVHIHKSNNHHKVLIWMLMFNSQAILNIFGQTHFNGTKFSKINSYLYYLNSKTDSEVWKSKKCDSLS